MKATELRIGNWIECRPKNSDKDWRYIQVDADTIKKIADGNAEYMEYRHITISEEILLNCGFKKNGCRFAKTWFYLWKDMGKIVFGIAEMEYQTGGYLVIKHVHQLQNLYFALTGKELNIEL